jgi:hypothetical protein
MSPGKAGRPLHLKIRVILTERMSVGEARRKLERTVRTGIVQDGIELAWINWRRPGSASKYGKGTKLDEEALEAIQNLYGAIHHPDTHTRIEVVDEG